MRPGARRTRRGDPCPGCEVSCKPEGLDTGSSIHVLVYFVEGEDGPLQDELRALRSDRRSRNRVSSSVSTSSGSMSTTTSSSKTPEARRVWGDPLRAGASEPGSGRRRNDAFVKWLGNGRPAYVPKGRLHPADVARLARGSGGVVSLAHPLTLGFEPAQLESFAEELSGAGFSGFEAIYSQYTPDQRSDLSRIARAAGLVPTGGSDYHGTFKPGLSVGLGNGDLDVPEHVLEELAARRA